MREITLSRGQVALIDDEDFECVSRFRWHASPNKGTWYARATVREDGKQTTLYLHRLIMNAPPGTLVDHRNHNGLDCRRENLRLCTNVENIHNRRVLRERRLRPTRGVEPCGKNGRFRARITINGKGYSLGMFDTQAEAARAYNEAAKAHHGEFTLTESNTA